MISNEFVYFAMRYATFTRVMKM